MVKQKLRVVMGRVGVRFGGAMPNDLGGKRLLKKAVAMAGRRWVVASAEFVPSRSDRADVEELRRRAGVDRSSGRGRGTRKGISSRSACGRSQRNKREHRASHHHPTDTRAAGPRTHAVRRTRTHMRSMAAGCWDLARSRPHYSKSYPRALPSPMLVAGGGARFVGGRRPGRQRHSLGAAGTDWIPSGSGGPGWLDHAPVPAGLGLPPAACNQICNHLISSHLPAMGSTSS
jgi:hypothetical protein